MKKVLLQRFFKYAVPLLLVSVFCIQFTLVHTVGLTQWKGGGFGMFSTIDNNYQRFFRVYLIAGEERMPVLLPFDEEFNTLKKKTASHPSESAFYRIFKKLEQEQWYCDSTWSDLEGAPAEKPAFQSIGDCILGISGSFKRNGNDDRIDFNGISIELFTIDYDINSRVVGERPVRKRRYSLK